MQSRSQSNRNLFFFLHKTLKKSSNQLCPVVVYTQLRTEENDFVCRSLQIPLESVFLQNNKRRCLLSVVCVCESALLLCVFVLVYFVGVCVYLFCWCVCVSLLCWCESVCTPLVLFFCAKFSLNSRQSIINSTVGPECFRNDTRSVSRSPY